MVHHTGFSPVPNDWKSFMLILNTNDALYKLKNGGPDGVRTHINLSRARRLFYLCELLRPIINFKRGIKILFLV